MSITMSVSFYHREHCHLCDEALSLLQQAGFAGNILMVDIDNDPELGVVYGLRIPVIVRADGQSLDWPFDAAQIRAFLTADG